MTAHERATTVRATLLAILVVQALLWGIAAAIVISAMLARPLGRVVALVVAAAVGSAIAARLVWRSRTVRALDRVALWIEEQSASSSYVWPTALDRRYAATLDESLPAVARAIAETDVAGMLRAAAARRLGAAIAAAVASLLVAWGLAHRPPPSIAARTAAAARGGASAASGGPPPSRLAPLTIRVTLPAYAAHAGAPDASRILTDPTVVVALVGSTVAVHGPGVGPGVRVTLVPRAASAAVAPAPASATPTDSAPARARSHQSEGPRAVPTAADDDGWRVVVAMPALPALLRLEDPAHERLVILQPIADAPPTVDLLAPARDTVLRMPDDGGARRSTWPTVSPADTMTLAARAADDIGLADGGFEVIVSSGEEGSGGVQARTVRVGSVTWAGSPRSADLGARLALSSLALAPGMVISVRAVARDGNTISGPGMGTSETRTWRVATRHEGDSLAIDAAPPPPLDTGALSQRAVVIATRALLRRIGRVPHPPRDTIVRAAGRLGDDERTLAERIDGVLNGPQSGDDDDRVAGNGSTLPPDEHRLLDTAAAALGDAARSLAIAEPAAALPRELRALTALDSARALVRRIYLRGQPPAIVIDVARVRLTGAEIPTSARTLPTLASDDAARLDRRLASAIAAWAALPATGPAGGFPLRATVIDSLTVLRLDALTTNDSAAAAIGDAVGALQAGRDAASALERARRAVHVTAAVDTSGRAWAAP